MNAYYAKGKGKKVIRPKWHFNPSAWMIGFLLIGPLILPLVWFNPKYSLKNKIVISSAVLIITWLLIGMVINALNAIEQYYMGVLKLY